MGSKSDSTRPTIHLSKSATAGMFSLDQSDGEGRTILNGERRRQQNLDDGEVLSNVVSYALETRRQMKHYESMYAAAQDLADMACDWCEKFAAILYDMLEYNDVQDKQMIDLIERTLDSYYREMSEA